MVIVLFSNKIFAQVVTDGLVLYVDARNSNSYSGSGNTWNDLSGQGNNGTITGATYNNSGWFNFDGSNDRINFSALLAAGDDTYTLEAYFNADTRKTQVIVEQNSSNSQTHKRGCMILISDGDGGFNGQSNDRHDHIPYTTNAWEHWVIAVNAPSNLKMYRNGNLVYNGSFANGGALNIGNAGLSIGYKLSNNSEYFDGQIRFVRVYNRTLSENEASQNYAALNNYSLNSAPTDITLSATAFNENISSGTNIASLTATDSDNGDSHTFTLANGNGTNDADNNYFAIQGASLVTSGTFDFETKSSYNVYINTNDGTDNYAKAFTVTVNDVNDSAPTDLAISSSTFLENATSGTGVASITTTDADTSAVNSFTYSLISGDGTNDADNSSFAISGSSLVTSGTFNYETKSSLKVYLQVSDGVASYAKALSLTVSDVNETPTDISLTSTSVVENIAIGTQVGVLSTTDPDSGNTFTYSLVSSNDARDDDNGNFTVSGTSLVTSSTIDFETKSSMNIYVNVNDGVNDYAKAFTISVSNTLEPITDLGFEVSSIVTDGLILHLDAGDSNSYSGSGNTWNDISGNSNHFDINNVATHNNEGYFLFNSTLVGGTGMIGPPSNSFGLSQTNHTIELVMTPTAAKGSIINFRGDSHDYP